MGTVNYMTTSICDLTYDLLMNILSRLRVKLIFRCRCVCKLWHILLTDPTFICLHLNQSNLRTPNLLLTHNRKFSFTELFKIIVDPEFLDHDECLDLNIKLPDRVKVLGSCNGIFCLLGLIKPFICLLNPSTGEHTELPFKPPVHKTIGLSCGLSYMTFMPSCGFGYNFMIKDYKVVLILCTVGDPSTIEVSVFSTGTNSWRRLELDSPHPHFKNYGESGTHVNGVLHWEAFCHGGTQPLKSIISFDLKTEKFGEILWPNFEVVDKYPNHYYRLCMLEGCLCIFHEIGDFYGVDCVEIWMMKAYGVESWSRVFYIQQHMLANPIVDFIILLFICKNGQILLILSCKNLGLYDPVAKTCRVLKIAFKIWKISCF